MKRILTSLLMPAIVLSSALTLTGCSGGDPKIKELQKAFEIFYEANLNIIRNYDFADIDYAAEYVELLNRYIGDKYSFHSGRGENEYSSICDDPWGNNYRLKYSITYGTSFNDIKSATVYFTATGPDDFGLVALPLDRAVKDDDHLQFDEKYSEFAKNEADGVKKLVYVNEFINDGEHVILSQWDKEKILGHYNSLFEVYLKN